MLLLAGMAGSAVWVLQGVLRGLNHLTEETLTLVDRVDRLNLAITSVQIGLYQRQLGRQRDRNALLEHVEEMHELLITVGDHYVVQSPEIRPAYRQAVARFPEFRRQVSSLATVQNAALSARHNAAALKLAMTMREHIGRIDHQASRHARTEQRELVRRFRRLVLGIAIGFVLVINVSILFLLRAAGIVLRPVDRLVETSRRLMDQWQEPPAHPDGKDEFSELADGYTSLAQRLQAGEQRKVEMLGQMALTLNHELNNAIAGIEMQIELILRRSDHDERFEAGLHRIQASLRRMTQTVESLKQVRRIVLTDYIAGMKMLDLRRSVQDRPDEAEAPGEPVQDPER